MDLYNFNWYNQEQKTALVWAKGTFISSRVSGDCTLCLYHMGKFFAEVSYRVADNEIESVRGFKSLVCLEPYLDLVDLAELKSI